MIPAGKVSKPNIRRITKVFCFPTAAGKKSYQVWGGAIPMFYTYILYTFKFPAIEQQGTVEIV